MSKKVDYDFTVDYAKSDRSRCKTSKEAISKGDIRIGRMVQAPNFDGKIPEWHYWKNFFAKGNKGLTQWEMLHGREGLRPADQAKIKALIEKHNGGGTKRALPTDGTDTTEEPPAKKQKTEETSEEKEKREQTEKLWAWKDGLSSLAPKYLKEILELNGQSIKGGKDTLLDRVVSGMMYGAPPSCGEDECAGGHIYWSETEGVYKCSGNNTSGWGNCIFECSQDVLKMKKYKMPEWKADNKILKKFKFQRHMRPVERSVIVRAAATEDMEGRPEEELKEAKKNRKFFKVGTPSEKPFDGYIIALAGKLSVSAAKLQKSIEGLGGKYSTKVTVKVTHCIATPGMVKKLPKSLEDLLDEIKLSKIEQAFKLDIPILSEDWIHETEEQGKFLNESDYLLGGTEKAKRELKREFTNPEDEEKNKPDETAEKKVKLVMKGRCTIDPLCGQKVIDKYHVIDNGGSEIYNVMLNLTDIERGTNSYYAMQVLALDDPKRGGKVKLFRKWGRVGTSHGGHKVEDFDDEEDAIDQFEELYLEKTGNKWKNRDNFEKKPTKFFQIDIDYSAGDKKNTTIADFKLKLEGKLQKLIELIFDVKVMEESLLEMEIDLKKMPLGNLSKGHIEKGYEVLRLIDAALDNADEFPEKKQAARLTRLTNQFYTLIPHDFGARSPTIIDTKEALQVKMKLMEALIDIEIAATLLSDGTEGDSPIDSNYKKLNTELEAIEESSDEWTWINKYFNNQKGYFGRAELVDCFKVARDGEDERFQSTAHLGNRQLLWHGSRVSNYVGILSQGLRIAPPEAPKSGYRFGKGIYFADLCEKSIGYCRGAGSDYVLMMLVEVALGRQKELLQDQYMEQALPGYDSTKAMGGIAPGEQMTLPDGAIIPYGGPVNTGIRSSCTHNEYIIYSVPQACIRYLLKIKLNQ